MAMMVMIDACGGGSMTTDPSASTSADPAPDAARFGLTSPAFADGAEIPERHGCAGEDVSPRLDWSGAPAEAAELVLVVDDPDARGFLHWLLTGIPAAPAGSVPEGRGDPEVDPEGQGRNSFGRMGWGGPCPPRRHTYVFTLSALSQPIDVRPDASIEDVRRAMDGLVIAEARLTGTYERGG
jgi:Raf kinase inhibitor-like YbhB/YbcL family protein